MRTVETQEGGWPLVIGHRGARGAYVENTIASFRAALDAGADGIEFDVRLSSDGEPVVVHDTTYDRTGLLTGRVDAVPAAVARAAGVPLLADVIALAGGEKPLLLVEMKTDSGNRRDLARAVARAIRDGHAGRRAVVLSFDHEALAIVKELDSSIATAASVMPTVRSPRPAVRTLVAAVRRAGADALALHQALATRARVEALADQGLGVHAWTVNRPLIAGRLARAGVVSIITDHPARFAGGLAGARR